MKFFAITLMLFVLAICYLKFSESKPTRKDHGKSTIHKSTTSSLQKSKRNSNGTPIKVKSVANKLRVHPKGKAENEGLSTSSKSKSVNDISKHHPKGKGKGSHIGKGNCRNDSECQEGYVCLVQNMGKAKKNSKVKKCVKNTNVCDSLPCMNNSTCLAEENGYTCQCIPGYTGQNSETIIQECTEPNRNVQIVASSTPRSICSPCYPDTYINFLDIRYIIEVETGENIQVTFTDFVVESFFDYVVVLDGLTDDEQFYLGKLSGSIDQENQIYVIGTYDLVENYDQNLKNTLDQPFVSSNNTLSILFKLMKAMSFADFASLTV